MRKTTRQTRTFPIEPASIQEPPPTPRRAASLIREPERFSTSILHEVTKGAVLVGAFVFAGVASLAVIPLPALLVFRVATVAAALTAAALGIYWLTRAIRMAVIRMAFIGDIYLTRAGKSSQDIQDTQQAHGIQDVLPPTYGEKIDRIARIILERHFLDNQPVTRETCETEGIASQAEWNQANQVLKDAGFNEAGIKGARSFQVETFEEALGIWSKVGRIEPDAILVRKEANNWKRIKL